MTPKLVEAHYVRDYVIRLRFTDGTEGEVDLRDEMYGEIFEPLKDQDLFRRFAIHPRIPHTHLAERDRPGAGVSVRQGSAPDIGKRLVTARSM